MLLLSNFGYLNIYSVITLKLIYKYEFNECKIEMVSWIKNKDNEFLYSCNNGQIGVLRLGIVNLIS